MHRSRPSPSPGPRWEALKEPPPTDSSAEEDEMEDEIEGATNAATQSSSHIHPPRKREGSDVAQKSRKRPRHHEQGGERGGTILAPGGPGRSGYASLGNLNTASISTSGTAGPSRISNAIPMPSTSISAGPRLSSNLMLPPPLPSQSSSRNERTETGEIKSKRFPIPSRSSRPTPFFTETSQHASYSKSKQKAPEASSSQRKDIPSSLSRNLFARSQAGLSSSRTSVQSQGFRPKSISNEVIDLTEEPSPSPSPPPPKSKSRSSLPNEVVNMSDEESSIRLWPQARKSTGGIPKPPPKIANKDPIEVIEISSGSEDEPPKAPPPRKLSESVPKSASVSNPVPKPNQAKETKAPSEPSKAAVHNERMNVDVPTLRSSEVAQTSASGSGSTSVLKPNQVRETTKAPLSNAAVHNERTNVDIPTRRPSELAQKSASASTSVPKANQAKETTKAPSSKTAIHNERTNVDVPTPKSSELAQASASGSGSISVPKASQAKETSKAPSSKAAVDNKRTNVDIPTRRPSEQAQTSASRSTSVPKANQAKETTKAPSSKAAVHNERMNVDIPTRRLSELTQTSASGSGSTSAPKANQAKETTKAPSFQVGVLNERMKVDLPTRRPLDMVQISVSGLSSAPKANQTAHPSSKMTAAVNNERMNADVPTPLSIANPQRVVSGSANPDQKIASREALPRDMQVDQVQQTDEPVRFDTAMTTKVAHKSVPSIFSNPFTPVSPSKSPNPIEKLAVHLQSSTPSSVPATGNIASQTPNRTQIAVKSTGGTKVNRERLPSPSSSSFQDDSVSDDKESPSRQPSQSSSSAGGGIDMRDLDHALGLTTPPKRISGPERPVPIKEQLISPQIPTISAKSEEPKRMPGPKMTHDQTLTKAILSAAQSDIGLRGETREQAIDLTLDSDEEISPNHSRLVESSKKLVNYLSKLKGKGPATSPSHSPTEAHRSGTDELMLRSAESDPSSPPSSPSPPLRRPLFPVARSHVVEARSSVPSARPVIGGRHHSAPEAPPMQPIQTERSSLTGLISASTSSGPSRPQTRPASLGSISRPPISEAASHKPQIIDAHLAGETSLLSSLPRPPQLPRHIIPTSPPRQQSSNHDLATSASQKSPSAPAAPSAVALGKRREVPQETVQYGSIVSDTSSDVDMFVEQEAGGASSNNHSEDEAMQDAEEVQALVEEDVAKYTPEPLKVSIPTWASTSSSGTNEAGPSRKSPPVLNERRRSSRRSSRSSTSLNWPEGFDDDDAVPDSVPGSRNTTPEDATALVPPSGKSYGGFPALTWKEYRKDLNNFVPKCLYAKDLPHSFQDHINQMSDYTRMMPHMTEVYEAMIRENTIENEPDAPPIELKNDVDYDPTPPWEFHYTNEMWHGEGVPPPDMQNLVSCNCKGACNPKSKTCACLARQRDVAGDPNLEFAYDKNGKLKIPGYPVFECNDLCGCGDECRNRVVQHGRKVQVFIRKTLHKGWGVFAGSRKIPVGTFIGIYAGELLTDEEAHDRGINYNKFGRTYLFDLDFHHQQVGDNWTNQFTVDAYHAGNFTRFLNHSCDPNSRLYPCYINEGNIQKPLLVIFSRRDIEPDEEICFSYRGSYPGDDEDDDNEGEEKDSEDNENPTSGKRDKIYERCMCGSKNCTGIMFA